MHQQTRPYVLLFALTTAFLCLRAEAQVDLSGDWVLSYWRSGHELTTSPWSIDHVGNVLSYAGFDERGDAVAKYGLIDGERLFLAQGGHRWLHAPYDWRTILIGRVDSVYQISGVCLGEDMVAGETWAGIFVGVRIGTGERGFGPGVRVMRYAVRGDGSSGPCFWLEAPEAERIVVWNPEGSATELAERDGVFYHFGWGETAPFGTYAYEIEMKSGDEEFHEEDYNGEIVAEPPRNITAQQVESTLRVGWDPVAGVDRYSAEVCTTSRWEVVLCERRLTDPAVQFDGSDLVAGADHRIIVQGIRDDDQGFAIAHSEDETSLVWSPALTISSTGGGSVTEPGEAAIPYAYDTLVPVMATAEAFHHFVEWTGTAVDAGKVANPNTPNTTVRVDANLTLKAIFAPTPAPDGMVSVPAGSFLMGDTLDEGKSSELPVHAVHVSAFYIDRYEVTNDKVVQVFNWAYGQGKVLVSNGPTVWNTEGDSRVLMRMGDARWKITWDGSSFGMRSVKGSGYPCNQLLWHGTAAYCNYRSEMEGRTPCYDLDDWSCDWSAKGFRLPTEAEWEKAARGGVAGSRFPWSDTGNIDHGRANYYSTWDDGAPYYAYDKATVSGHHPSFKTEGRPYTSPVGSFMPNGYGLYDTAGSLSEWCWDAYASDYYASSPDADPRGPEHGAAISRTVRGGCWDRAAYTSPSPPP